MTKRETYSGYIIEGKIGGIWSVWDDAVLSKKAAEENLAEYARINDHEPLSHWRLVHRSVVSEVSDRPVGDHECPEIHEKRCQSVTVDGLATPVSVRLTFEEIESLRTAVMLRCLSTPDKLQFDREYQSIESAFDLAKSENFEAFNQWMRRNVESEKSNAV